MSTLGRQFRQRKYLGGWVGRSIEVIGDGTAAGWARDARFLAPFGGFGYVTLKGGVVADSEVSDVSDVSDVLSSMYAAQESDPDEISQG
jgi:hypothetical protein